MDLTAVIVVLVVVAALGALALWYRARIPGDESDPDFEIIARPQRPRQPPLPAPDRGFHVVARDHNVDGYCLLTGMQVKECTCDKHRTA
ncbi:hypothetical protein FHS29_002405 [Saccharothrix tamanrassetensis]|uniref:Uncharacterized protein n=1 Tax=Saccharothrix tamanrassetensis TaxID=1051531 RepID=A0A841CHI1_9PSEU|nr:hypothetical protein [Saccharothrix tamanrassetensis]MBB5955824.1 hypothetical protein [Saccharothrix tamanrassetensis]